jgi:peptide/nickel transport system permease protein
MRHRLAVAGTIVLVIIVMGALFADFVSSRPFYTDITAVSQPPSPEHLLGTDRSGRDVWARVAHGARTSLLVGLGAVFIYVTIGTILGGIAGMMGGWVDGVIMRATDALMSIPTLLLVIVFVSAVGPSLGSVVAVIGLLGWPGACRLVRGQLLSLRESEFVAAARVVGMGGGTSSCATSSPTSSARSRSSRRSGWPARSSWRPDSRSWGWVSRSQRPAGAR